MTTPFLDIDRTLPDGLLPDLLARIRAERPDNLSAAEAAADAGKLWAVGRTLPIAFMDQDLPADERAQLRALVKDHAATWLDHANLHFAWDQSVADALIRISFDPPANWSYIGLDAILIPQDQPTMNLGGLRTGAPADIRRQIILHEFGHALGLIHEHQSPVAAIEWNRDAVIKELSGPPNHWDKETIEINIFYRYGHAQTQYGDLLPADAQFDDASIMVYPIPQHWTVQKLVIQGNTTLSATDKAFIARCYPAAT
ncbi:MAG: hypothetical protein KDA37_06720 [Planctomycetales bacterium]|nr:hypothetical protein [Planctomycetales bacterium]